MVNMRQRFRQVHMPLNSVIPYVMYDGLSCIVWYVVLKGSIFASLYSRWQMHDSTPSRLRHKCCFNPITEMSIS